MIAQILDFVRWLFSWAFLLIVHHPYLSFVAASLAVFLVRDQISEVAVPFLARFRRGAYALHLSCERSVQKQREEVSRDARVIACPGSRPLLEDLLLFALMATAFFMAVKLSLWIANSPIQDFLYTIGADPEGQRYKGLLNEQSFLFQAIVAVEVFCGIMILDLVGGTKVFGIVNSYNPKWRWYFAGILLFCVWALVQIDNAIADFYIHHFVQTIDAATMQKIQAQPDTLEKDLREVFSISLFGLTLGQGLSRIFGISMVAVVAFTLFPLDVIKALVPITTNLIYLVFSIVSFILSLFTLVLIFVIGLVLTILYRTLIAGPAVIHALWRCLFQAIERTRICLLAKSTQPRS